MRAEQRLLLLTAAGAALVAGAGPARQAPLLLWNLSGSAPVGPYVVLPLASPRPGGYAVVRPEARQAEWMARRGYLPRHVPLLKRVAARPGQMVCRHGARIVIDGREAGRARAADRLGRPLPDWAGCRRIGAAELFLLNPPRDSLDGRYFGPTARSQVLGAAWPVLVR